MNGIDFLVIPYLNSRGSRCRSGAALIPSKAIDLSPNPIYLEIFAKNAIFRAG